MELRLTLAEQLRGVREGLFDAGFARTDDVGEGIVAQAIWHDPLVLAVLPVIRCLSTAKCRGLNCSAIR